jgi:hypothetical protein
MLPPFSLEFRLDLGAADCLPLSICQRDLAILTSESFLQIPGGGFSTHNSNGTFLQSRKHFGQSGECRIRFDSHVRPLSGGNVMHKRDENPLIVILTCDILQKFPHPVMLKCDVVKSRSTCVMH